MTTGILFDPSGADKSKGLDSASAFNRAPFAELQLKTGGPAR